jgi:HAD superfamily hydrolase (TIGR01662 family)
VETVDIRTYSDDDLRDLIAVYWRPYINGSCVRKGVNTHLQYLQRRGMRIEMIANNWSGYIDPVLKREGLHTYFDAIVAGIDVTLRKPDPRIFQYALEQFRVGPHEAMMVGDDPLVDIQGAHRIGMRTTRIRRGPYQWKPDFVTPDFTVRNIGALTSRLAARIDI